MPKEKYKTQFNFKLQQQFPFLKPDPKDKCNGICTICKGSFSVAYKGRTGIENHVNSLSHVKAVRAPIENNSVTQYFQSASSNSDMKIAAQELTFAYHSARHGISLRAAECNSQLISSLYEPKFTSGRSKTSAIIKNVRHLLRNYRRNLLNLNNILGYFTKNCQRCEIIS